jgi:hypothetical protein
MKSLSLALIIFLSSCMPQTTFQRCAIRIKETLDDSYCLCHMYEVKQGHVGRISESMEYDLQYCDKFIAVSPKSWADLYAILNYYLVEQHQDYNRHNPFIEH